MEEKYRISWDEFFLFCNRLAEKIYVDREKYTSLYPVMKNGLPIAERLSLQLNIPIVYEIQKNCLIIDDLIDSGRTLGEFEQDKAVLFVRHGKEKEINYFVEHLDKWVVFPWEKENDICDNIIRILEYIGENPNREGLKETPQRIVNSWKELFSGYNQDPCNLIKIFEDGVCDEMIILKNIEFYSFCEHHFLPFFGRVDIGYVPNGKVIGVSKLARLTEVFARRLQIQERLTQQIADFLFERLEAKGVMVKIEAVHFCMIARGIQKQNSKMITSAIRGVYEKQGVRQEFLNLIKNK